MNDWRKRKTNKNDEVVELRVDTRWPRDLRTLDEVFLRDPVTSGRCFISSLIVKNGDGSFAFIITNEVNGDMWKFIVRQEEFLIHGQN